jgi:hypothetical protein
VRFSRGRSPEDIASQVLALNGPCTVLADVGTADVVRRIVRAAGEDERVLVRAHPYLAPGHVIAVSGGRQQP